MRTWCLCFLDLVSIDMMRRGMLTGVKVGNVAGLFGGGLLKVRMAWRKERSSGGGGGLNMSVVKCSVFFRFKR